MYESNERLHCLFSHTDSLERVLELKKNTCKLVNVPPNFNVNILVLYLLGPADI